MNDTSPRDDAGLSPRQRLLHDIIFEADTAGGKAFDVGLFIAIGVSVSVAMLDSVKPIHQQWGSLFWYVEILLTILFTIEYVLRLYCVGRPLRYATSFFGIVDLLSIVPGYLAMFDSRSGSLVVLRVLRLLRVFRVLKLGAYLTEAQSLLTLLNRFRNKITVFIFVVMTIVMIMGSVMYVIEGEQGQFDSIPKGVYWAIVTVTTVGYGDISPTTTAGQAVAALAMLIGYAIIVVPASIFAAEVTVVQQSGISTQTSTNCMPEGHDVAASYCKFCGTRL